MILDYILQSLNKLEGIAVPISAADGLKIWEATARIYEEMLMVIKVSEVEDIGEFVRAQICLKRTFQGLSSWMRKKKEMLTCRFERQTS